jgi:outer membrane biosynthesis protein TonB
MTFEEYKDVILNGERVEWYGELVPKKLLTPRVHAIANMIVESLNKMESELDGIHGNSKEKASKQRYINDRWHHIKTLPYHSNGLIHDAYMAKYKRIIEEDEKNKEKTKPKKRRTRKPKVEDKKVTTPKKVEKKETTPEKENVVVKGRKTKNSKLIFGK